MFLIKTIFRCDLIVKNSINSFVLQYEDLKNWTS